MPGTLSPGTLIGSYRLVRLLGEGAMGAVYEAEHTVMERRAAVKLLHSEVLERRSSVQRFLNEARAMSRLRHPGLVEILELGELSDGAPYLVMELLTGETLSARLARTKRWPPVQAIELTRQIAEAMLAAHAQGIVHRDLKPSNLMLIAGESPERLRVKVLDFGIAKLAPLSPQKREADALTRSQAVLGTAEYMAPEQCRDARGVDAQADVYALGVILYELLAGQRPFAAATALEVMVLQLQAAPPLLKKYCPDLGGEVLSLVHQMLAKAPHDRPTMAEVAARLSPDLLRSPPQVRTADDPLPDNATLEGVSIVPRTGESKFLRRQALWMLLGLGGLAPLLVGSGLLLRPRKPKPQRIVASPAAPEAARPSPPIAAVSPIPKAASIEPAAGPPPVPLAEQKPEAPPHKAPPVHRPQGRPVSAPMPPVFFKNKDPDGL